MFKNVQQFKKIRYILFVLEALLNVRKIQMIFYYFLLQQVLVKKFV